MWDRNNFVTLQNEKVWLVRKQQTIGRRIEEILAGYLYDCSKMMYGSVAVGGLSPLFTGKELAMVNIACIIFGFLGGAAIANAANYIMKFKS